MDNNKYINAKSTKREVIRIRVGNADNNTLVSGRDAPADSCLCVADSAAETVTTTWAELLVARRAHIPLHALADVCRGARSMTATLPPVLDALRTLLEKTIVTVEARSADALSSDASTTPVAVIRARPQCAAAAEETG